MSTRVVGFLLLLAAQPDTARYVVEKNVALPPIELARLLPRRVTNGLGVGHVLLRPQLQGFFDRGPVKPAADHG